MTDIRALQDKQREEIRVLCQSTGLTPSTLARKAGLAPSTLNRFMNASVHHALSARTLERVRAVAVAGNGASESYPIVGLDEARLAQAIAAVERAGVGLSPEQKAQLIMAMYKRQ